MTKLLIAGDFHGNVNHANSVFRLAKDRACDRIIQIGDFGLFWGSFKGEPCDFSRTCSVFAKEYGIPMDVFDGNHENFDALAQWPTEPDGTKILATGIRYLPRGYVFIEDGIKFLVCGGATSIDRKNRVTYVTWWPTEAISDDDVAKCAEAGKVDVLLTHDFPSEGTILPPDIDPWWGEWAQYEVTRSRRKISKILAAADPAVQIHGHLHIRYDEEIWHPHTGLTRDMHKTHLIGVASDMQSLKDSTYIFDTEHFNATERNKW